MKSTTSSTPCFFTDPQIIDFTPRTYKYNITPNSEENVVQIQDAVPAVRRWFYGRGKRWLFVFDNADEISDVESPSYVDLRYFLPDDPGSHVIVTSRDRSVSEISGLSEVEVDQMSSKEAAILFQRQAKIVAPTLQQKEQMTSIVKELGHLALAITLAGTYVAATPRLRGDLMQYLPEYQQRRKTLLAQRPGQVINQYGESALTTWETTYRAIEGRGLDACVIFSEKRIDAYDIEGFFRVLASFSLVKYQEDQSSYSMHNLVQAWAYDRLENSQQQDYGVVAARLLLAIMDNPKETFPVMMRRRFLPHVVNACQRIIDCFNSVSVQDNVVLDLLSKLADFLDMCGDFRNEMMFRRFVFRKHKAWYGETHPDTVISMDDLAVTLGRGGELQEALSMKQAVLAKRQQILGKDHPDTLRTMHNLAATLADLLWRSCVARVLEHHLCWLSLDQWPHSARQI